MTPEPPILRPGMTYETVTDKISSIVLTRKPPPAWIVGAAFSFSLMMVLFYEIGRAHV